MFVRMLRLAALAAAISAGAPAIGHALSFDRVPGLDELSITAPIIFRGRVVRLEHRSIARRSGKIAVGFPYTEVTFIVGDGIAGVRTGETLTLRRMGGRSPERPELVAEVPGVPVFQVGGEYVVFADPARHPLLGAAWGEHGALRVVDDGQEGPRVLDHGGRLLGEDDEGRIAQLDGLRCTVLNGPRCGRWISEEGPHEHGEGGEAAPKPAGQGMSPSHLAARIRALRAAKPGVERGAAAVVDRATFEGILERSIGR